MPMKIFVLVEGPSDQILLDAWAPRAFPGHQFELRPHQGKGTLPARNVRADPRRRGLLDLLPATLRAYSQTFADDEAVLVLVDADDEDCVALRAPLIACAQTVPQLKVVLRIAVEETETFYFGDLKALARAYPKADLGVARAFEPDSRPSNGTAEAFAEVVGHGTLR